MKVSYACTHNATDLLHTNKRQTMTTALAHAKIGTSVFADPSSTATNLHFEGEALINSSLLTLAFQSIALWNLFTKACGYRNKAKTHQKCCA